MPSTLSGAAQTHMGSCDPRCEKHAGQKVSRHVRAGCTREIEVLLRRKAALANNNPPRSPPIASTSTAPQSRPIDLVALAMQTLSSSSLHWQPEPGSFGDPDECEDITMPTWSLPPDEGPFEYGASDAMDIDMGRDEPNPSSFHLYGSELDSEADSRPQTPGSESEAYFEQREYSPSPTPADYTSGSEADIETDVEVYPHLDNLEPISPASSSRPSSPRLGDDSGGTQGLEIPESEPFNPPDNNPNAMDPPPQVNASESMCDDSELPNALRAFREWILKLSSTGDVTVKGAESFLKTLNMCLENDFLRCGPDVNPKHRLPLSLETLQRHASEPSDFMEMYAVCPDFSCQTLRAISSMKSNQYYTCSKCGKLITQRRVTRRRGSRKVSYHYVPILQYSTSDIERQIQEILGRPGILEAIRKHREYLRRAGKPPGTKEDIQDGDLWQNFKKGDFNFFNDPFNIGLILMCDWFQPTTRQGAQSYSTGAISLCIANLPPHLRARPENKILVGVIPGPHEPNVDTINNFLEPMVNELLRLWDVGTIITGPDGATQLSRVALVACACDSPAARKLGGFGGTGSTYPCTACWCSLRELHIFNQNFPRRTRREHKRAAESYQKLPNKSQRQKFITAKYEKHKPGGYRYSALLKLPYWDSTTMVVVDPMHCLFLGLVDWQFHTIWVDMKHLEPGKELDELQEMVKSTLRPRHCGRPPSGLGTSAAGSLTSDPLRSLITIDLPLAIPVIWDKVDPKSVEKRVQKEWARRKELQERKRAEALKGDKITREATKARQRAEAHNHPTLLPRKRPRKTQVGGSKHKTSRRQDEVSSGSDELPPDAQVLANAMRTQEDDAPERGFMSWRLKDDEGILWLSSAVKHLCSRTVTEAGIQEGERSLNTYLNICTELRGSQRIHPNHHFASHLPAQLRRYGPMHQIWTYSGERLNYTLKNTNSNRHRGGEQEKTFAITFHRRRDSTTRLSNIAANRSDPLKDWASYMLSLDSSDLRGTVGTETFDPNGNSAVLASQRKKPTRLPYSSWELKALGDALARAQPNLKFRRGLWEEIDAPVLNTRIYPIREVTLNGRVYSMSSLGDSIIKARVVEEGQIVERVGEIIDLWEHIQPASNDTSISNTFALVHWYKAAPIFLPRPVQLWSEKFPQLDIEVHVPNEYLERHAIIPTVDICCHCARMSANLAGDSVWLTIGLERE